MGVVALVAGWTLPAQAQQPVSVRLDYERQEGTSVCPDASAVAASVSERLGYEPFDAAAPETVKVRVLRKDRTLQAKVEMVGQDGKSRAERLLTSRRSDCADLAATMALTIAIA